MLPVWNVTQMYIPTSQYFVRSNGCLASCDINMPFRQMRLEKQDMVMQRAKMTL